MKKVRFINLNFKISDNKENKYVIPFEIDDEQTEFPIEVYVYPTSIYFMPEIEAAVQKEYRKTEEELLFIHEEREDIKIDFHSLVNFKRMIFDDFKDVDKS